MMNNKISFIKPEFTSFYYVLLFLHKRKCLAQSSCQSYVFLIQTIFSIAQDHLKIIRPSKKDMGCFTVNQELAFLLISPGNYNLNNKLPFRKLIALMLCSLCFKQKPNCVHLSCNHNVCLACIPKRSSDQSFVHYQCQTCLTNHQIDLTEQTMAGRSRMRQYSRVSTQNAQSFVEAQCIFCWTCHQAITLKDYIKGRHREHQVQTYEQAIPSIKNLLLEQLQKSKSLKEYLNENLQILEKNRLKQNYQETVDKVNEFFHKQIEILERKRLKVMQEVESSFVNSLKEVQKQINVMNPFIDEIDCLETKVSQFITDQVPITEINPISGVLETIEEYTQALKGIKFSIPELPQFIVKSSVKQSIENACLLFVNKPKAQSYINKVSIKKPSLKDEFQWAEKPMILRRESRTQSKMNINEQPDEGINRKVRLVEKVKGKMKYTSTLCSTAFS